MKKNYDLLIIGGGSAGLMAVPSSRQLDLTVALAEKDRLGGDCTWTGCVPGKTLLRAAKSAQNINDAAGFSITSSQVRDGPGPYRGKEIFRLSPRNDI